MYFICLPKKSPLILVKNHKKSEVTFLRLRYYLAVAMNQQMQKQRRFILAENDADYYTRRISDFLGEVVFQLFDCAAD